MTSSTAGLWRQLKLILVGKFNKGNTQMVVPNTQVFSIFDTQVRLANAYFQLGLNIRIFVRTFEHFTKKKSISTQGPSFKSQVILYENIFNNS